MPILHSKYFNSEKNTYFDLLHYQPSLTSDVSNLSNCKIFISGHLMSGHFEFWFVSGRVSGHLVSGHFSFRVVSGRIGSGIRSSNVRSFRILGRIVSG
jgi:hypothetical protein